MVSGLRHGADHPDEELWDYCNSVVWQVGSSGGLVESPDHKVCCVEYFQPCGWTSGDFSW
jgi:hypothetical protein